MVLGNTENDVIVDDGDGGGGAAAGGGAKTFESVPCSICLEVVSDNGDRSLAKLQCGHQFHLDCIGSAFNIKGSMQCPNCRKIEKGQWLYANGCRSLPEFSMDDWAHDDDLYDLSYPEMSFGVHWCPYGSLARLPSFFEEGEFPPNAYHDLVGQHAIFAEHSAAVTSTSHPCPYVAYFGPIHPSSSNSSPSVSEGPNYSNHWNSSPNEIPSSYGFPAMDLPYHGWDQNPPPFSTTSSRDQPSAAPISQRPSRSSSDLPRPGPFMHPFIVGHGSSARAGSSVGSSMAPPYQGSNARARDRVQALQAYYQQQPGNSSGNRRSSSHRGTMASSSDQSGFYWNFQEPENPTTRFRAWDRDHLPPFLLSPVDREPVWGTFHQVSGGSDPGIRRQRHVLERLPSQNRS